MKVLILFAHPAYHKSNVNKVLLQDLQKTENITLHDLYQEYPDFNIDIKKEQELLSRHDCIIFHFPFFWYSTPALLKEWQDLVLQHGWAYGSQGNQLKGKLFFCALSLGGSRKIYREANLTGHSLEHLLSPIQQTAILCKMQYLPPFTVYGTHAIEMPGILEHKRQYSELLRQITQDEFELKKALEYENLNYYILQKDS